MARYYQIDKKDLTECLEALKYIADRKGKVIDDTMVEYFTAVYTRVSSHLANENEETPNDTIGEINMIQNLLGGIGDE